MSLKAGSKLGPYEILEPIGAGGMGEVYRARDERLSRDVAVKVLPSEFMSDPDRVTRFQQEARAAGQLNHPNIVAVYDIGIHEGSPYVVQELLEGETLRAKLKAGPLPPRKAVDLARQVALGLAPAHHKGIVHRDLKPENLFVTHDGRVKILDFGLAKLAFTPHEQTSMTSAPTQAQTEAGVILGTVGYMSPEQVRGQRVDPRSDIFSFGAVLHEMLTGRRAFHADSAVETMNAILQSEPRAPSQVNPEIPPGLDRILQRCLEKSPDERFQSASDLAFQLEALSTTATGASVAAPVAVPATRRSPARRAGLALLGVVAIVTAFLAGRGTRDAGLEPTYTQLTFRQGSIFSARFTPDGQTAVYAGTWDGAPTELFSVRRDSPGSRSLGVMNAELLSVSASGEMAVLLDPSFTLGWMRTGTLARIPMAGGLPREVLEDVQDADWSPDGDGFVVVRSVEGFYRLEHPIGRVLFKTDGWISTPRFSPDGERIGFVHHTGGGDSRGLVRVVDRSAKETALTPIFSDVSGLAWSPSGEEIWFTAGTEGNVKDLYAVDLAGNQRKVDGVPADLTLQDVSTSGEVLLTRNSTRRGVIGLAPGEETERELSHLDWTRPSALTDDGRWLLFEEQGVGGGRAYSIYLRGTDGSPPVRLGEGTSCDLSPDGQWALTITMDEPRQFVLLPRGPGEARPLDAPGLSHGYGLWFPDGNRLLLYASQEGRPLRHYVFDLDDGTTRPVTPEGGEYRAAISPDGTLVVTLDSDGILQAYPVDGGDPRPIPGAAPEEEPLRFHKDGRSLFVARRGELPTNIDRLDLRTGERTLVAELMPADGAGLLDVAFIHLSSDGSSYVYSYRRVLSTLYTVGNLQ